MFYNSLNNTSPQVSFKDAVLKGLAPDRGLYFPSNIKSLSKIFFNNICSLSHQEIAFEVIRQFVGKDIPELVLKQIIRDTLSFDFPLVQIGDNMHCLELFHGPTMAFKDVGARFMARTLGHFNMDTINKVTVLVATSGDTGGAVASGFWKVKGVEVVILFPKGKVSDIQEKQLTTFGENITAIEVEGTFDDCQNMVKKAFLDENLSFVNLTSANSINVARWLPQMFYYFFAYKQLKNRVNNLTFSVPSGNFGNICAAVIAKRLGLPVNHFIASTNINDIVPTYLNTGVYTPKPSQQTISNAMDVGNPSNFIRIQKLYSNNLEDLKKDFSAFSFNDIQTREALKELLDKYNYIADPHGAVAYLGAKEYLRKYPEENVVFLETAHPSKFIDVVESTLKTKVVIPIQIASILGNPSSKHYIKTYKDLKTYLKDSV